jgi:hypothetical protein
VIHVFVLGDSRICLSDQCSKATCASAFGRYAVPLEKSFWFRWMFFKLKKVCQAKVSKSSKISLVDQVFCISRMKNALNAWTKGMIVIRSETAFLLSRWRLFCLAVRMRKTRHKMKREVLRASCAAVIKRAFTKWANDVKNALSYVVSADNSFRAGGALSALSRAFYIWTEQRAHSILVGVFMLWSRRARQRITWTIFLRMHAALSQRKLMISVFKAWRQPAQASFLSITDAEAFAMYALSHAHDPHRTHVAYGNRAFKAAMQQTADARNYTFVRACHAMQSCPFENADRLCIQLTSASWLQQIKPIIAIKPSGNFGRASSSQVPYRNLLDVFTACRDLLGHSFVEQVMQQPRKTFSRTQDVSECNWGESSLSAAAEKGEYRQSAASLVWSDLVFLLSATTNSRAHESSLRQHATKAEIADAIKETLVKKSLKSNQIGADFVSRCLQLTGMRMWLSSVVGGWSCMSTLVPLTRNIAAIYELRLKERRALVLRDNLLIISGKVKDESSIFAALFKTKKAIKKKPLKKARGKKKSISSKNVAASNTQGTASGDDSAGTACSPSLASTPAAFPEFQVPDSIIKPPNQQLTMIQRLTNMVHCSDDPISSFALSETVAEAMQPDSEMFEQQLHNRYVEIANDIAESKHTSLHPDGNSDSDDSPLELNGMDSDDEETFARIPGDIVMQKASAMTVPLVQEDSAAEQTAVTLDTSSSSGPDFHISLAMKQYVAPKPIRIPRVALPVSLLAIARDLATQLNDKYENAKADLPSQILEVVAHKPSLPETSSSSENDEDTEEKEVGACSSHDGQAVAEKQELNFISDSSNEIIMNSDLEGVKVNSQFTVGPNILFDTEGALDIDKDDLKHLDRFRPRAPQLSSSFTALESKFIMPFSPQAKGKPFEHWDPHDQNDAANSTDDTPVLLAIPPRKTSKQPKTPPKSKKQITVFSSPMASMSLNAHADASSLDGSLHTSPNVSVSISQNLRELDFSLPDTSDPVKIRQPHSNEAGAFPAPTSPSKQNRQKGHPDRLEELIISVKAPSAKPPPPETQVQPSRADAAAEIASGALIKEQLYETRRQYSEVAQKNASNRRQMQVESSSAARALTLAAEGAYRRERLLHEATESAYDALDVMPPHLKVIFEENFDALINRVIDANTKIHASADHHHWHELNQQRKAESRTSSLGGLVADTDSHNQRVFQSRQHYRAMMAKHAEVPPANTGGAAIHANESQVKSKPSVELERLLFTSMKAPISAPTTFTSGDREFVTGIAKPLSAMPTKAPISNPSLNQPDRSQQDFTHVGQMQLNRLMSRSPFGQGTAAPFASAPAIAVHSTPREQTLVHAPQFVTCDPGVPAPTSHLHITGSELSEPNFSDNAEAAFLKAKLFRPAPSTFAAAAFSNSGMSNPAFRTDPALKTDPSSSKVFFQTSGLPAVGGKGLGISVPKRKEPPKLESSLPSNATESDTSAFPSGATILEQAAISNVQGLVQAKSIFKAVPLQPSSSRAISRVPSSMSSKQRGSSSFRQSTAGERSKSFVETDAAVSDSSTLIAPKALSSSQILGIGSLSSHSSVLDADSEVEFSLAASGEVLSGSASPSLSPQHSESPIMAGSAFTASHAVADFNRFLATLSINDVVNKSQVSLASNSIPSRGDPVASSLSSAALVDQAQQVANPSSERHVPSGQVSDAKPVSSATSKPVSTASDKPDSSAMGNAASSSTEKPVPSAINIAVEVQSRGNAQVEGKRAPASTASGRSAAVPAPPASAFVPVVSHQAASPPSKHTVSVLIPSVVAATVAAVPVSHAESEPSNAVHADLPASSSAQHPVVHIAPTIPEQPCESFTVEPVAAAAVATPAMFDHHASSVCRGDEQTPESAAASLSAPSVTSLESAVSVASESLSSSVPSVPQAPHTTPQTSQPPSTTPTVQTPPQKVEHVSGVKGSAIRSFLLSMQGKAAADSAGDGESPEAIVHQQRASAIQLIRQRTALQPKSSRKSGAQAAAASSAAHAASTNVRRQTLDKNEDDSDGSDGELNSGHIFKNQKIVRAVFYLCVSVDGCSVTIICRKCCRRRCRHYRASSMLCVQCQALTHACIPIFFQF